MLQIGSNSKEREREYRQMDRELEDNKHEYYFC
jgi:hypothetical protein